MGGELEGKDRGVDDADVAGTVELERGEEECLLRDSVLWSGCFLFLFFS